MSLFNNAIIGASGQQGYKISRSVRLRSSASAYLSRTLTTPTNNKIWTWSGWIKRGKPGGSSASGMHLFGTGSASTDAASNQIQFDGENLLLTGYATNWLKSNAVFRDPSAWYHIVVAWDNSNATVANRAKIYVNGIEISYSIDNRASLSTSSTYGINQAVLHTIGAWSWNNGTFAQPEYYDGYLTEVNFIDGQALTPSSFGETNALTGVWQPKKYAGTYGTNGFYLNFSDNSAATAAAIGKDNSGNGNNWTPNNISVTAGTTYDSMLDVPTQWADGGNGRGNYAVLNPLLSAGGTTANGNLQITTASGAGHSRATVAMPSSGKWYCEFTAVSASTSTDYIFGIVGADTAEASYGYNQTPSYAYTAFGERVVNGSFTSSFYSSYTTGDVIGCAVDLDTNQLTWYKNGTAQTAISITNGSYFWIVSDASGTRQITAAFNAGQRPFTYTPPTGFKALNTQNLPTPTIVEGNAYFDVVTRNGTGSAVSVSSLSFQPDSILTKLRNTAYNWYWADAVRGVSKTLSTDTTAAEQTPSPALFTSFNSDGYTLGTSTGSNGSTYTYVDYVWNAGGSTVTNTSGSISAQVRANATAGFSVVTLTAPASGNFSAGHGLGVTPGMVITKVRGRATSWITWHNRLNSGSPGTSYYVELNTTSAQSSFASVWGSTGVTSSVIGMGVGASCAASDTIVAYCFAAVAGYSAFGSYTGNGSADGTFVFTGFRPRFVLIKQTSTSGASWTIHDSARNTYNLADNVLYPNLSSAETSPSTQIVMDFLSNGFKLRGTAANVNASGATYIYAAFAEVPFKSALGR